MLPYVSCEQTVEFLWEGMGGFSLPIIKKKIKKNDHFIDYYIHDAGTYLSVNRNWGPADKLTLDLPFSLRTEAINGNFHNFGK